ncbi:hypothetical protein PO085_02435, partial [Bacteroides thetaiotaomicron]|uniref:hypothetical protein n=1 Tax=Bacteroides thetaiotaomicron TaxID=818 RepID=UPI002331337D
IQNHYSFVRFAIAILFYTGTLSGAYTSIQSSLHLIQKFPSKIRMEKFFLNIAIPMTQFQLLTLLNSLDYP